MRSLVVLFYMLLVSSYVIADEREDAAYLDSLFAKVEASVNTTFFLQSIDGFYKASCDKGSARHEEWACLSYVYYYYMNYNKQGVLDWYARLEGLVGKSKHYPELFMGKYLKLRFYDLIGDQSSALAEMDSAYAEANRLNDPFCQSMSCLGFANIYMKTKQNQEALDMVYMAFPGGVPKVWRSPIEILALNLLANITYIQGNETLFREYLGALDEYLEREKENRVILPQGYVTFNYFVSEFNNYRLRALYNIGTRNLANARLYMNKINGLLENSSNMNLRISKYSVYVEYYMGAGVKDSALVMLDNAIEGACLLQSDVLKLRFLHKKANVLSGLGRDKEAEPLYRQVVQLQDSISKDSYARKIGEFNIQWKAKKIEMDNEHLKSRKSLLYWAISSLLLFCLFLIILFFVTNRLKWKLERRKQKAEDSERLKSVFLANMNHEIRTPLNAITGFCDLLADETDPDICEQYIEIVENNNELLTRLINDVVDITKIEAGMIVFSYSEVHLPDLMKSVYKTFSVRMEDGVELILDPVGDIHAHADKVRLVQVVTNLLTNAMKHTLSGSIRLGYEVGVDKIRFYVADTGKGIPENEQEGIFTRFVQGKDRKGGVGLGLALCRGFVTRMGGEIGVISKVGEGSTFWFTLPYQSER